LDSEFCVLSLIEMLEYWSIEVLECWNVERPQDSNTPILQYPIFLS
jgi:hypothetical protein